jgi:hypothetical protein
VAALRPNGHRGTAGDDHLRRRAPANPRLDATDDAKDQGGDRENQKLTGNAMDCSVKMGKVRIANEL